jgi:hypothetical protein
MNSLRQKQPNLLNLFGIFVVAAIAGCGGGGGGAASVASSGCAGSGSPFVISTDTDVEVGKAAGAGILGCTTAINNPQWSVESGPLPIPLAAKSQAVGFDIPAIGVYELQVTFSDDSGKRQEASVRINGVTAKNKNRIVARVDQAVRKGGQLSFHAWETVAPGDTVKQIT